MYGQPSEEVGEEWESRPRGCCRARSGLQQEDNMVNQDEGLPCYLLFENLLIPNTWVKVSIALRLQPVIGMVACRTMTSFGACQGPPLRRLAVS